MRVVIPLMAFAGAAAAMEGPASSISGEYEWFFWIMVTVCGAVAIGIAGFLVYAVLRYHRRHENQMGSQVRFNIPAEVTWIAIPSVAFMGMFAWGTKLYFDIERPPDDAIPIYVVAQQWMWKLQHTGGQREINELHIPVNTPIKLTMTSQDVIHSFFVPSFRIKQDVLPGRYTSIWFEATKPGRYHLFCAEYCGTKHSGMIGWVEAMEQGQYQEWLASGGAEGSLASLGEKLFHQYACANCHHFDNAGNCPDLRNLYSRPVLLETGETVTADDAYIRESLVDPKAKVVNGYKAIMPSFQGQLSEEQIIQLISFIKAIGPQPGMAEPVTTGFLPAGPGAAPAPGARSKGK